eukprot:jgi/Tetstr1/421746/TSEL_001205.t1
MTARGRPPVGGGQPPSQRGEARANADQRVEHSGAPALVTAAPAPLHGRRSSGGSKAAITAPPVARRRSSRDAATATGDAGDGGQDRAASSTLRRTASSTSRRHSQGQSAAPGLAAGMRSLSMGSGRPAARPTWGAPATVRPSDSTGGTCAGVAGGTGAAAAGERGPKVLGVPLKVRHPAGGAIDVLEYAPRSDGGAHPPAGVVIALPGSNGGFGPGIEKPHAGLPLARQGSLAAQGSLYARLGLELSTGLAFDWACRQVGQGAGGGAVDTSRRHFAVLHATWRLAEDGAKWPGPKLKHLDSMAASLPGCAGLGRLGHRQVWRCTCRAMRFLLRRAVCAGGSARLEPRQRFERRQLDTLGAMRELSQRGTPVLLLHGTRDANVAVEIPIYMYQNTYAEAGLTLALIRSSMHQMDRARDVAYPLLRKWVLRMLRQEAERRKVGCRDALAELQAAKPSEVRRLDMGTELRVVRADRIADAGSLPVVALAQLQNPKLKGYSE